MELNQEQERVAQRIQDLVTQKDASGEPKFQKAEIRDFLVACVLELGLEITPEVQAPMTEMLANIELPEDADQDQIVAGVHAYFEANPLNPELVQEMEELARTEVLSGGKGYKDRGEQQDALKSVGKQEKLAAPKHRPKSRRIPKMKRGIEK